MSTPEAEIKAQLAANLVQNTEMSVNLGGSFITTTEDKVRLAVLTHLSRMEKRYGWISPFGVLLSVVGTFITTDFKDRWLPAASWEAVYFIVGAASACWLAYAIYGSFTAPSIDDFVKQLKAKASG
jgi:hypothetical protein